MVSYSVPAAEYVSLELKPVLAKARAYKRGLTTAQILDLHDLAFTLKELHVETQPSIGIVIPTEVYYARSIDVTVSTADASSGQLSAVTMAMVELSTRKQNLQDQLISLGGTSPPEVSPEQPKAKVTNETDSPSGGPTTGETTKNNSSRQTLLQSQISSIQSEMAQLSKSVIPDAPGVTGSVTRSSANGVTLSQTFYYPVAVGFRGLTYDLNEFIDKKTVARPKGFETIFLNSKTTRRVSESIIEDIENADNPRAPDQRKSSGAEHE